MHRRVICSAVPATRQRLQVSSCDAHVLNARNYALPRLFEATRRRGVISDVLVPSMFPPSSPEAAHVASLCTDALTRRLAAIEGSTHCATPGSQMRPTPDTPLAVRGVALDKYVDDEMLSLVHAMRKHMLHSGGDNGSSKIQIVDVGCGYGTRPWNLPLSGNVHWFDVDLPSVLQDKLALLEAAGGYTPVVCHMLKGDLGETLRQNGWDPTAPTIWLAFALLYYLDDRAVDLLMKGVAAASRRGPCAAFLGSVMNAGMVELIQASVAAAARQQAAKPDALMHHTGAGVDKTATVDPESSGSVDVQDAIRRSEGVQQTATMLKFGCRRGATSFLRCFGWDLVEEVTPYDIESMYGLVTVGLEYPPELWQRMVHRHGQEPTISVCTGRMGF